MDFIFRSLVVFMVDRSEKIFNWLYLGGVINTIQSNLNYAAPFFLIEGRSFFMKVLFLRILPVSPGFEFFGEGAWVAVAEDVQVGVEFGGVVKVF